MEPKAERLIIALDFAEPSRALELIKSLELLGVSFKIGLELYMAGGPALVAELASRNRIFLDLKFHDIPSTVAAVVRKAAALGVWMLNVHAAGGRAMMAAAREAVDDSNQRPLILGVTVLTSMNDSDLAETGYPGSASERVVSLSRLAFDCGLDGIICSPQEVAAVKKTFAKQFLTVTPGVRPAGTAYDDQLRTAQPAAVIRAGGDYLVVGRPVTRASDPLLAAAAILEEMGAAQ